MGFVRLSNEILASGSTAIENLFIVDYMPHAPEGFSKVYIYGLFLSLRENGTDNSIQKLSKVLNMQIDEILAAYDYWQSQGLVRIIPTSEFPEIEYLKVGAINDRIVKYKPEKYAGFNKQLEAFLPERVISLNEYDAYYSLMENYHLEQEALLEIVSYCARRKGDNIGFAYIMTVARNLVREGLSTYDQIHERLTQSEHTMPEVLAIYKMLGIKRNPDYEDAQLVKKWTQSYKYNIDAIKYAAKKCKNSGGMAKLDAILTKFFQNETLSKTEMQDYDRKLDTMYSLARKINYYLGLSYQQVDFLVDTFVSSWLKDGFDPQVLEQIAENCAKNGKRSWELLDNEIKKLHQKNVISPHALSKHLQEAQQADVEILKLLQLMGIDRPVTSRDRDNFRTWTYSWQLEPALIECAAVLSKNRISPLAYLNTVLSTWSERGIKTLLQAKQNNVLLNTQPNVAEVATQTKKRAKANVQEANYQLALSNPRFLECEKNVRTLQLEYAKNETPAVLKQLNAAQAERESALKALGLTLEDLPKDI